MESLKNPRNKSTIWPSNPIHSGKTTTLKDMCTPVFTEAIFTIGRTWKQPRCPQIDEWLKKVWNIYCIYYGILLGHRKE